MVFKEKKMIYFSGLFRVLLVFQVCCFSLPMVTIMLIGRRILFENDINYIIVSLWSFGGNIIYVFISFNSMKNGTDLAAVAERLEDPQKSTVDSVLDEIRQHLRSSMFSKEKSLTTSLT